MCCADFDLLMYGDGDDQPRVFMTSGNTNATAGTSNNTSDAPASAPATCGQEENDIPAASITGTAGSDQSAPVSQVSEVSSNGEQATSSAGAQGEPHRNNGTPAAPAPVVNAKVQQKGTSQKLKIIKATVMHQGATNLSSAEANPISRATFRPYVMQLHRNRQNNLLLRNYQVMPGIKNNKL